MITRDKLPDHPVSALDYLADCGWIPRPVYVGQPLRPDAPEYALVVEIEGYGHRVAEGAYKAEAKRRAAEALLTHILAVMCPHPDKIRYATEEFAYSRVKHHQAVGTTGIRQAYLCRCGWWHLTSRAAA